MWCQKNLDVPQKRAADSQARSTDHQILSADQSCVDIRASAFNVKEPTCNVWHSTRRCSVHDAGNGLRISSPSNSFKAILLQNEQDHVDALNQCHPACVRCWIFHVRQSLPEREGANPSSRALLSRQDPCQAWDCEIGDQGTQGLEGSIDRK